MIVETDPSVYENELLNTGTVTAPFKPLRFSFFMQL